MLWGKTKCQDIAGWEGRIASKLVVSAFTGAAVGAALATLQSNPVLRGTITSTASFVLLMGCFASIQETTRLLRCYDSPANSAVAGWATGTLLFRAHGRPALQGAVACSTLGAAAHWGSQKLGPNVGLQGLLIQLGLLDEPEPVAAPIDSSIDQGDAGLPSPWWERFNPVRKMTDEEAQAHEDAKQRALEIQYAAARAAKKDLSNAWAKEN